MHMLVGMRGNHCVADLVREIKKASFGWVSERTSDFAWQVGYEAFSIGQREIPGVVAYIARQEEHHRTVSSRDELRTLLAEFGVEYDERFFE